jgi:hypothetical protein
MSRLFLRRRNVRSVQAETEAEPRPRQSHLWGVTETAPAEQTEIGSSRNFVSPWDSHRGGHDRIFDRLGLLDRTGSSSALATAGPAHATAPDPLAAVWYTEIIGMPEAAGSSMCFNRPPQTELRAYAELPSHALGYNFRRSKTGMIEICSAPRHRRSAA